MLVRLFLAIVSFAAHAAAAMVVLAVYHWLGTPVEATPYDVMTLESQMVAVAGVIGMFHGYTFPALGRSALKTSIVRTATAQVAGWSWCLVAAGGIAVGFLSDLPDAFGSAGLCIAAGVVWHILACRGSRKFERLLAQRGAVMFSLAT
ncbi:MULTISPECIES: hypothetical protein [unclassified Variovorax]|uniref:hypothetical protein n=1 Tax=unclassified Variovorax TaxID=663243 RepID=UPI00131765A8|nr:MULTISPECIES: hypothetical protein [unclassified Variovorax]VTU42856.1 hypothetical protein H6P1_00296 [Variovorax sp. PBL-H6]VTU43629.1 hypothetical protein SRS16P1_00608 [Variovorax sp. SRS16]VTU43691.1 hypothetical protein E5P1_00602 [Variovorax sp. PBL-E5]